MILVTNNRRRASGPSGGSINRRQVLRIAFTKDPDAARDRVEEMYRELRVLKRLDRTIARFTRISQGLGKGSFSLFHHVPPRSDDNDSSIAGKSQRKKIENVARART